MSNRMAFNIGLSEELCEYIEEGGSLREFCRIEGNPSKTVVLKWLRERPEFAAQYTAARARQMDHYADEIISIADTPVMGTKRKIDAQGGHEITEGDMIEHRRLQVDARKWLMGKLAPKKYGDKLDVTSDGKAFSAPVILAPGADK